MNTIRLSKGELDRIIKLMDTIHETDKFGFVTLNQSENTGIGYELTATFDVTHKGEVGEFTVTITDHNDW